MSNQIDLYLCEYDPVDDRRFAVTSAPEFVVKCSSKTLLGSIPKNVDFGRLYESARICRVMTESYCGYMVHKITAPHSSIKDKAIALAKRAVIAAQQLDTDYVDEAVGAPKQ